MFQLLVMKSAHLCRAIPGALKLDKLGLSGKANKYSDAETGGLDVLPTKETSSMNRKYK